MSTTKVTAADMARLRNANNTLVRSTRRKLMYAWGALDLSHPKQASKDLTDVMMALGVQTDMDARVVAMEWYEELRNKVAGLPHYTARAGGSINHDKILGTVKWANGALWGDNPDQVADLMATALDRWEKAGSNDALRFNAVNDKSCRRFARVPAGAKTCAFCTMLASRGWVYATYRNAGGNNPYHAGCDCLIVPNFDKGTNTGRYALIEGYDPQRYRELYERGYRRAGGGSRSSILTAMRKTDPDQYTDGVWSKLPSTLEETGGLNLKNWEKYRRDLAFRLPPNTDGTRFKLPPQEPATPHGWDDPDGIQLRTKEWNHILYGDVSRNGRQEWRDHHRVQNPPRSSTAGTGYNGKPDMMYRGGHMWGHNWMSGGDTFPQDWGPDQIQHAIADVIKTGFAYPPRPGERSITGTSQGVTLVVRVRTTTNEIVTAYPLKEV